MPKLILMCGAPGSGKSTYVQNNLEDDSQIWVSRDKIRFSLLKPGDDYHSKETQVYNIFCQEIIEGLKNDYDVYADATHLTRASRKKLLMRIPKELYDELEIIWVKVDVTIAVMQNEQRAGSLAYVPPSVLRKMYFTMSEPSFDEGFDTITIVERNKPIERRFKE